MEAALVQIGLPVICGFADCGAKDLVKPHTNHNGWYKSKLFRKVLRKKWYCPEHYQQGREIDNHFYKNYLTPDPYDDEEIKSIESTQDELYKLLD